MSNDPQENHQVLRALQEMEDGHKEGLRFVAWARKALSQFGVGAVTDELQERRNRRHMKGFGVLIGLGGLAALVRKHSDQGKAILITAAAGLAVGAGATVAIDATLTGSGSERDEAAPRPIVIAPSHTPAEPPTPTHRTPVIAAPPPRPPARSPTPTYTPRPTTVVTLIPPPKVITRPPHRPPPSKADTTPTDQQPVSPPATTSDDDHLVCELVGVLC